MYGISVHAAAYAAPARGLHALRHHADGAFRTQLRLRRVVDQIRPVAHRPIVAHRRDRRNAGRARRVDRRHGRHGVLAVHQIEPAIGDAAAQKARERRPQPFVLFDVPDERDIGGAAAILGDRQAFDDGLDDFRVLRRVDLDDFHVVTARDQAACEFERAPAAAAAYRRKGIRHEQHAQRRAHADTIS